MTSGTDTITAAAGRKRGYEVTTLAAAPLILLMATLDFGGVESWIAIQVLEILGRLDGLKVCTFWRPETAASRLETRSRLVNVAFPLPYRLSHHAAGIPNPTRNFLANYDIAHPAMLRLTQNNCPPRRPPLGPRRPLSPPLVITNESSSGEGARLRGTDQAFRVAVRNLFNERFLKERRQ